MSKNYSNDEKGIDASNGSATQQPAEREQALARIEELEQRIEALEGVFSERVVEKENGHVRAQERDAREKLRRR